MKFFGIVLCIVIGDVCGDLQRVDKSQKVDSIMTRQTDVLKVIAVRYSVMQYFSKKLPDILRSKISVTDDAENIVLQNYVKSQSVPTKALDAYNLAKKDERELLKRLVKEVPRVLPNYKALRKGVSWNYTRLHDKFGKFFQEPSATLEHYEAFKRDELTSLNDFLADSNLTGVVEGTKTPQK